MNNDNTPTFRHKCTKCNTKLKIKSKRYLIYEHKYYRKLLFRLCEKCYKGLYIN